MLYFISFDVKLSMRLEFKMLPLQTNHVINRYMTGNSYWLILKYYDIHGILTLLHGNRP